MDHKEIAAIKKKGLRDRWLYPIIAVVTASLSSIIGWLGGREDERMISRETGEEYPFNGSSILWVFGLTGSIIGIGSFSALKKAAQEGHITKRKMHSIFAGFMVALALVLFAVSYRLSQPINYYSGSILYDVFSRDPIKIKHLSQ